MGVFPEVALVEDRSLAEERGFNLGDRRQVSWSMNLPGLPLLYLVTRTSEGLVHDVSLHYVSSCCEWEVSAQNGLAICAGCSAFQALPLPVSVLKDASTPVRDFAMGQAVHGELLPWLAQAFASDTLTTMVEAVELFTICDELIATVASLELGESCDSIDLWSLTSLSPG